MKSAEPTTPPRKIQKPPYGEQKSLRVVYGAELADFNGKPPFRKMRRSMIEADFGLENEFNAFGNLKLPQTRLILQNLQVPKHPG